VLKNKALPALAATGRVMGRYSLTMAAVGGVFAAVDVRAPRQRWNQPYGLSSRSPQCLAEGARGKKDFWNGAFGGAAAGSVLGVAGASGRSCRRRDRGLL
jgi:hypothetical protein